MQPRTSLFWYTRPATVSSTSPLTTRSRLSGVLTPAVSISGNPHALGFDMQSVSLRRGFVFNVRSSKRSRSPSPSVSAFRGLVCERLSSKRSRRRSPSVSPFRGSVCERFRSKRLLNPSPSLSAPASGCCEGRITIAPAARTTISPPSMSFLHSSLKKRPIRIFSPPSPETGFGQPETGFGRPGRPSPGSAA